VALTLVGPESTKYFVALGSIGPDAESRGSALAEQREHVLEQQALDEM
jgi:hypothetical protein